LLDRNAVKTLWENVTTKKPKKASLDNVMASAAQVQGIPIEELDPILMRALEKNKEIKSKPTSQ
jgi:hypothetical protein